MKIYTKTGDDGSTGLFGGQRAPKHDPRVAAYGTVDELNSVLGLAIAAGGDAELTAWLKARQPQLFALGSILAAGDPNVKGLPTLHPDWISSFEQQIDTLDAQLAPLRNFIMPGGSTQAAWLHFARTVCRRAERELTLLRAERTKDAPRLGPAVVYLNRLSDWLFVLARAANQRAGIADVEWIPEK